MKYLLISLLFIGCTKQFEAPVYWDVKIAQKLPVLEAIAYNSKSTNLKYEWIVNGVHTYEKTVTLSTGRSEVQLVVFDDKGNSIAEYLNVVR